MEQVQNLGSNERISYENFDANTDNSQRLSIKHNRIAEKLMSLQIDFTSKVQSIVAFKDSIIFIYFLNGRCMVQDLNTQTTLNKFQMPPNMDHFRYYDEKTVLFLNTEKYVLQLLNIYTGKIVSTNHPKVPSEINWQLAERKPRKIDDLISSGLTIHVLQESKMVIVLEQKNIICSVNDYVLTTFHFEQPTHLNQIIIPDEKQKSLAITPLNQVDTVMIWGAHHSSEDLFEMFTCNVFQGDKGFSVVKLDQKITCDIVAAYPLNDREVSFWVNKQQPAILIVDWVGNKRLRAIDLNVLNPYDNMDTIGCILNDVYYLNQDLQIALVSISTPKEESFSVINLIDNKVSFTKALSSEFNLTVKCFSPDGKYYIEFEKGHNQTDDAQESSKVYFTINYMIGMRASILYLLEKKKIQEIYGQYAVHQVINMLTQSEIVEESF